MLSVLDKTLKRRKPTSKLSKPEDCFETSKLTPQSNETKSENSAQKSNGSVINAETLDRPRKVTPSSPASSSKSGNKHTRDIVFLDGGISEICRLLRELDPQAEVHVLDQHTDGVDQIVTHLAGRKGFQAVHIFCFGGNGIMKLGNGEVTTDTITTTHSKAFSRIGAALSRSGEILIYGCDFCAGANGRAAAAQIAMLTGAEIAASADIFADNKFDWTGLDEPLRAEPSAELKSVANVSPIPKKSELSYALSEEVGQLEVDAENGLLHSAGLVGSTLSSATDGSDALIKINEPGVASARTHILPNGAELVLFSNGAFTYQSEADAGEGEIFNCLVVGSDCTISKFAVSINVNSVGEISGDQVKLHDESAVDSKFASITTQAQVQTKTQRVNPKPVDEQITSTRAINPASQLSINVPDTSAGPIAETTTMVDAPLIFLRRNNNAISVNGSDNDIIVLTLSANNGTLSARPSKGAQVEGYNSKKLTITGSVVQINAALNGLRYVNSGKQSQPDELVASARYDNGRNKTIVSKTVAISVTSLAVVQNTEKSTVELVSKPSVEIDPIPEIPSVFQDEQPSKGDAPIVQDLDKANTNSENQSIVEFIAPIGAVITTANAGETMKLKEGNLQIDSDGSFSFSLKEGYTSASSHVTCCVNNQNSKTDMPSEFILDLSQIPLHEGKVFAGNVFSSDIYISQMPLEKIEVTEKPSSDTHSEAAKQIAKAAVEEANEATVEDVDREETGSTKTELIDEAVLEVQTSTAIERQVSLPEALGDMDLIVSSVPIVLAGTSNSTVEAEVSDTQFDQWDIEDFNGHSLNFSFNRKGQQTDITPAMRSGQITVDTYTRQQTIFLDVNSTFDTQVHGKVESYHVDLSDGSARPDWMRETRNGFISLEIPTSCEAIELKILAKMNNGNELSCSVSVDRRTATMKPISKGKTADKIYQREQAQQEFASGFASA